MKHIVTHTDERITLCNKKVHKNNIKVFYLFHDNPEKILCTNCYNALLLKDINGITYRKQTFLTSYFIFSENYFGIEVIRKKKI